MRESSDYLIWFYLFNSGDLLKKMVVFFFKFYFINFLFENKKVIAFLFYTFFYILHESDIKFFFKKKS